MGLVERGVQEEEELGASVVGGGQQRKMERRGLWGAVREDGRCEDKEKLL